MPDFVLRITASVRLVVFVILNQKDSVRNELLPSVRRQSVPLFISNAEPAVPKRSVVVLKLKFGFVPLIKLALPRPIWSRRLPRIKSARVGVMVVLPRVTNIGLANDDAASFHGAAWL